MRTLIQVLALYFLLALQSVYAQTPGSLEALVDSNGVLLLDFDLEEYSAGPRTGPAQVYGGLPAGSNPWTSTALLDPTFWPPIEAVLTTDIGGICGPNVALAGGSTGGWLFGPYLPGDPTTALADIRDIIPGAPDGTAAYAVLVGTSIPDGNWARRLHCDGSQDLVESGIQIAFIYPTSTLLPSGAYQIGDFWYITEIGDNFYRVLSPTPLGPVTSTDPASAAPRMPRWRNGEVVKNGILKLLE
jgi:hypothetical protein